MQILHHLGTIRLRLKQAVFLIYIALFGYIAWFSFQEWERAGYLYSLLSSPGRAAAVFIGVLLLGLVFYRLCPLMERLSRLQGWRAACFPLAVIGVIFLIQLALLLAIGQTTFMYDPYRVFDEALRMLSSHTVSGTALEGYFSIYPNNIFFAILCYWLLLPASALGISDAGLMLLLQIVNAIAMDLAIWIGYRMMRRCAGGFPASLFLLLCFLNPLVYLWPGFAYTSTFSMPFIIGACNLFLLLLASLAKDSAAPQAAGQDKTPSADSAGRRPDCGSLRPILYAVLLGIVLMVGFRIRATVIITLIAGLICLLLPGLRIRRTLSCLAALILSLALSYAGTAAIQNAYVNFDYTDTAFPVVSWLAMGANPEYDGMFNTEDYYDTLHAPTKEEKEAINQEKLSSRLQELGLSGWLSLAGRKLVLTWADGSDDYVSYLNQYAHTGKLHTYLLEDKKDFILFYMQVMRVLLFLASILAAAFLLPSRRWRGDSSSSERMCLLLLCLNLIGGSAFHVLWETGELYSLCFSFLLFLAAAWGLAQCFSLPALSLPGIFRREFIRLRGRAVPAGIIPASIALVCTAAAAGWMWNHTDAFTAVPVSRHETAIAQRTYTNSEEPGLTAGETLTQTFQTDQAFNRVCLRVKNVSSEAKDSRYQISVVSEDGTPVLYTEVTGQDVFDYDYLYLSTADTVIPNGLTTYTITVGCMTGTSESSIAFLRYDTGSHDAYPGGSLAVSGEVQERADLNFLVYHSYEDMYFRPAAWYALCTLVTAGGCLLFLSFLLPSRRWTDKSIR